MKKYKLANKYNYSLYVDNINEDNKATHKQSYLHFVSQRKDLVSAKCFATDWLIKDIDNSEYSLIEYFAGVGISSEIYKQKLNIKEHKVIELDINCYRQLSNMKNMKVKLEDGHKAILKYVNYDIKVCDWGTGTIVQYTRGKWTNFLALFINQPKYVIWTDTSVAFPAQHSSFKIYAKELNTEFFSTYKDYYKSMSEWLFFNSGYSISKIAYRGKNACYILAKKGQHEIEEKIFTLKNYDNGFLEL
tara:strand:+ start:67 stop:804 length:738 start_codon:yes stop_codon:yes gene_type:complete